MKKLEQTIAGHHQPPHERDLLRLHGLKPGDTCPACGREAGDRLMRCACGRPYQIRCRGVCGEYVLPVMDHGVWYDPPARCTSCELQELAHLSWNALFAALHEDDLPALKGRVEVKPHQLKAVQALREWVATMGNRALMIHGSVGSGKTWSAVAELAMFHMQLPKPIVWTRFDAIIEAAKKGSLDDDAQAYLRSLERAGTLVIDEFGSKGDTHLTAHVVGVVDKLLYRRFSGTEVHRKSLMIGNRAPAWHGYVPRSECIWDDRVASRFAAIGDVIEIVGPDLRRQRA